MPGRALARADPDGRRRGASRRRTAGRRHPSPVAAAPAARGGVDRHGAGRRVVFHLGVELVRVTVTAAHVVEPHPGGSRLTLGLTVSGPLSGIGWLFTRSLTKRYVRTEAASIKSPAESSTT